MERNKIVGVTGATLLLLIGAQGVKADIMLQPQAVPFGYFQLTPVLNTQTSYDNNIYNLADSKVGSWIQMLNPSFNMVAQDRVNKYSLNYSLKAAGYANDSNDSYNDHFFSANAHIEPSDRLRLDGGLGYNMQHDDRGISITDAGNTVGGVNVKLSKLQGLNGYTNMGEVDKYNLANLSGGIGYGAQEARGQILATANLAKKRYDRDAVAANKDNDALNTLLEFKAKLTAKTNLLLDYERVSTNYVGASPDTLDNRYLLGAMWEATGITTGKLRLGQGKRDIGATTTSTKRSISNFTWDLGASWTPTKLDTLNVNAGAKTIDATYPFSSTDNTSYSIGWMHSWLDRVNSSLSLGRSKDDYILSPQGQKDGNSARNDTTTNLGVGFNYQMRPWLIWSLNLNYTNKDSSNNAFDSKKTVFGIGTQISL